jgi:hypothetical protein
VQPGNAREITFLDILYACTHGGNRADAFVARHEGRYGPDGPVASCGVQVGMANAGDRDLEEHFAGARGRDGDLVDDQGPTERVNHRRQHGLAHEWISG